MMEGGIPIRGDPKMAIRPMGNPLHPGLGMRTKVLVHHLRRVYPKSR